MQRAQVVVGQRQRRERHVAHQARGREPLVERTGLCEQPAARERGERVGRALQAERGAQRRVHALERRGRAHQLADRGRLLGEHLARQVAEQRPARPAQALDRRAALGGRQRADGLTGQAHRRGPALRDLMKAHAELPRVAAELGLEHRAHLVDVEGEVGAPELEELALPAQAVDREGQLGARGEDDVQGLGRLAAQRLDRVHRGAVGRQCMEVVEHEPQRAVQALLQGLGQRRGEGVGAGVLVRARVGPARGAGRGGEVDREVGHAQAQRVHQAAPERRERCVLGAERVPGDVVALRPGRQQRRLAGAGAGDDGGHAAAQGLVQACLQLRRGSAAGATAAGRTWSSASWCALLHAHIQAGPTSCRQPARRDTGPLRQRLALVQPRADAAQVGLQALARRRLEGQRKAQLGRAQRPAHLADPLGALADAVEDARRDLVAALPRHGRAQRARVAQGAAGGVDEQRLGGLAVGHEGAVGPRDDADGQSGAAPRLRAGDGEQQRVARAVGRDAVEQQVVDGGREDDGFEVRAGELGQRVELVDGIAVARAAEPCRELVERAVGAGRSHGDELGRERQGELARGRASAAGLDGEGHHLLGHPNTNWAGRE